MIINKENVNDVDKIYIHDAILTDFNYNFYMEKLSLNLLSTWNETPDFELIFKRVITLYFQNADFWGAEDNPYAHTIYYDEDLTYYNKLIEDYKNQFVNEKELPSKFNDDVMEIVIQMISGGEIRILCSEIIVNEYSN